MENKPGSSSVSHEPKTLVNASNPLQSRERSTSTHSRRASYYDQQRTGRRPRPISGTSFATTGSHGKRWSQNLTTEEAIPRPVDEAQRALNLEGGLNQPVARNFSRRNSQQQSRNSRGEQELTEVAGPPPVPHKYSNRASATSSFSQREPLEDAQRDAEGYEDGDASPPPFVQRHPEEFMVEKTPLPPKPAAWLTELYTISYLIFFSFLGTLARLGVQWLTFYPGTPNVTPVIWANFGGSLIMGFLAEDKRLFRDEFDLTTHQKQEHSKVKKTIPLYVGLATGFCGSFTSFSSFMRDVFLALSNNLPTPINHPYAPPANGYYTTSTVPRNGGYSFEALLAIIISTLALSLSALILGAHLAMFLESHTPRISSRFTRTILDRLIVPLAFGSWLAALFLCIWPPDRPSGPSPQAKETWRGEVLFSLLFAPAGCILRYYASMKLNGLVPSFPLGTFAVNMLGTAILGMCYDIQRVGVGTMGMVGGGRIGCQVLQGIEDGFCGCLTTVSTWVAEINGLKRRHGYAYAAASLVGALGLLVAIMGSVRWSVGWEEPVCPTGYTGKIH